MDDAERNNLVRQLKNLSTSYTEERKAKFVENLPESLGLE